MSQFQILGRRLFSIKAVSIRFAYTNFPDMISFRIAQDVLRHRRCVRYDDAGCARVGAGGCRGFARGRILATSGRFRRKRAPISPWVLGFCAVFCGSCSLSASPIWGNAGAARRFGPIRPVKPPRSCKRSSLAVKVAHLDVCFDSVCAGRHPRMNKRLKPAGVQAVSRKPAWWRGECGHVYHMAVRDRVRAKPDYCPYCLGRKKPERPIRLD